MSPTHPVVILENGDHSHTSRGDTATLLGAIRSVRSLWPTARIGVVSTSRTRLALVDPGVTYLAADQAMEWTSSGRARPLRVPAAALDAWWSATQRWEVSMRAANAARRVLRRVRRPSGTPLLPDLVLAVGGGYFCDMDEDRALGALDLLDWGRRVGATTAMTSQGVGPVTRPALLQRMAAVLPHVDRIVLRERLTGPGYVAASGVDPARTEVGGDDALLLATAGPPPAQRTRIGVSMRQAAYLALGEGVADSATAAVAEVARRTGATARAITACEWADEDRRANRALLRSLGGGDADLARSSGPVEYADAFRDCRVALTTTYHTAVFALGQGAPAVCLSSSPYQRSKFDGLSDLYEGCGIAVLDTTAGITRDDIVEALLRAWADAPDTFDPLAERTAGVRDRIAEGYGRIGESVRARHAGPLGG